ncbi:S24/S26 family peptidase [Deinococcus radiomollis]|uniref:S24 family peptidase n=1 Tax=Deinococcus radiomollis TaxID=468916 RepID=UPI003891A73E
MDQSDVPFERQQKILVPRQFRKQAMIAMRVQGNSMTLPDGTGLPHNCYVLIDVSEYDSRYGHVYAFRTEEGELVAKRLILSKGYPTMSSDNEDHAPLRINKDIQRLGRIYAYTLDLIEFKAVEYRSI